MLHLLALVLVVARLTSEDEGELMGVVLGTEPFPLSYPANTIFATGLFIPNRNGKGLMMYGGDIKMELPMPFKKHVMEQCIALTTRRLLRGFFARLIPMRSNTATIWLCKEWTPCSRSILSAMVDPQGVPHHVMRICMHEDWSARSVLLTERYDSNGAQGSTIKSMYGEDQSLTTAVYINGSITGPMTQETEQLIITGAMVDGLIEGRSTVTFRHDGRWERGPNRRGIRVGQWVRGARGGPATEYCEYSPDGAPLQQWARIPAPAA